MVRLGFVLPDLVNRYEAALETREEGETESTERYGKGVCLEGERKASVAL
jgi:hypothetical protein